MNIIVGIILYHAIYISYTEVQVTEDYCRATSKIFADDLADAVRAWDSSIISRSGVYDSSDLIIIEHYLKEHLYAIAQSDTVTFKIYDYSKEGESVWLELYSNLDEFRIHTFHNSLLVETFPSQANMLKVVTPKSPYLIRLHKKKTKLNLN